MEQLSEEVGEPLALFQAWLAESYRAVAPKGLVAQREARPA